MDYLEVYQYILTSFLSKEMPSPITFVIWLVLFIFVLYTFILAYHLIRYGIGIHVYVPVFVAYLAVSFVLIGFMIGSATFLL